MITPAMIWFALYEVDGSPTDILNDTPHYEHWDGEYFILGEVDCEQIALLLNDWDKNGLPPKYSKENFKGAKE